MKVSTRMQNISNFLGVLSNLCTASNELESAETLKIIQLRRISYGFVMPTIGLFGVIGNILNLIVLTRRNMQGTAYVYMRAYSLASLLAILFCIPFVLRVLVDNEKGAWTNWWQAFYHVHLELYFSNGFIGVSVMMLSALTLERHAVVCRVGKHRRPICGTPKLTAMLLALATFLIYLPNCFRTELRSCFLRVRPRSLVHQRRDNVLLLQSSFYQVYRVMLELLFKIGPTILIAALNLRIMLAYRRSCRRRRRMSPASSSARSRREAKGLDEERRLMLMLGGTSMLFFVCVSPMIILNLTLDEDNLTHFPYQVFRSLANLLELTNYSLTFYIYCLFSEDFRGTLARTFKCPWSLAIQSTVNAQSSSSSPSTSPRPTLMPSTPVTNF